MAAVGNRIYVVGGGYDVPYARYEGFRGSHADAFVLDLDKPRWRKLQDLPFGVGGLEAAAYRDRYVLLTGGEVIGTIVK